MNQFTCNDELSFTLPDGFESCTAEELKLNLDSSDHNWKAVRNKERHIVLIVRWQKFNSLALKLADSKSMIKSNEKRMSQVYEGLGAGYRLLEFFTARAGKKDVEGYRYTYQVEGVDQTADTVLVKTKNHVYNVTFYYRSENSAADRGLIDDVLKTAVV